jgi:ferredoxin
MSSPAPYPPASAWASPDDITDILEQCAAFVALPLQRRDKALAYELQQLLSSIVEAGADDEGVLQMLCALADVSCEQEADIVKKELAGGGQREQVLSDWELAVLLQQEEDALEAAESCPTPSHSVFL